MLKKLSVLLILFLPLTSFAQEVKAPPPTATTHRVWRQAKGEGHFTHFYDYAKFKKLRAPNSLFDSAKLPAAPAVFDWGKSLVYPMFANDQYGDCFYASACHHDQTMTGARGLESIFNVSTIVSRYKILSGGDNGLSDSDIQDEWKDRYLADVKDAKIVNWLYVDTTNPSAIGSAMYYFGGTQFTFTVPSRWISDSDTGSVWDVPCPANNNGHAVHWVGVNDKGQYKLVTWGTYVWITPAAVKACDPSGFVVFSARWFDPKTGRAPNGLHIVDLAAYWQQSGGKAIPASIINAFPPPTPLPPDPPRPPIPPTPGKVIITLSGTLPAGSYEVHPAGTKERLEKLDAIQKILDDLRKLEAPKKAAFNRSNVPSLPSTLTIEQRVEWWNRYHPEYTSKP